MGRWAGLAWRSTRESPKKERCPSVLLPTCNLQGPAGCAAGPEDLEAAEDPEYRQEGQSAPYSSPTSLLVLLAGPWT